MKQEDRVAEEAHSHPSGPLMPETLQVVNPRWMPNQNIYPDPIRYKVFWRLILKRGTRIRLVQVSATTSFFVYRF